MLSRVDGQDYRLGTQHTEGQSDTLSMLCMCVGVGVGVYVVEGVAPRLAASRMEASCVRMRRL